MLRRLVVPRDGSRLAETMLPQLRRMLVDILVGLLLVSRLLCAAWTAPLPTPILSAADARRLSIVAEEP